MLLLLLLKPSQRTVKLEERPERLASRQLRLGDEAPQPALQLLPPPVKHLLLSTEVQCVLRGRGEASLLHHLRLLLFKLGQE